jgi:hypothetical protein
MSMQAVPRDTQLSVASLATLPNWLAKKDATLTATAEISLAIFSWVAAACKVAPTSPLAEPIVGEIIGAAAAAAAACLNAAAALGKLQAAGVHVSRCLDPAVAAAFDLVSVVAVDLCGYAVLQRKRKQKGSQVSTNRESATQQQQRPNHEHQRQQQPQTQPLQLPPPQQVEPPQPPLLHLR